MLRGVMYLVLYGGGHVILGVALAKVSRDEFVPGTYLMAYSSFFDRAQLNNITISGSVASSAMRPSRVACAV